MSDAASRAAPDAPDTEAALRLRRARHLAANRRRWPLVGLLVLACWFSVYVTLTGRGRRAALARLERSRPAALALAPPAVPAERNAAEVWRRAFAAIEGSGFRSRAALGSIPLADLADPATFAPDGVAFSELAERAQAIELALEALAMEECDWELDYSAGFLSLRHDFLSSMERLAGDIVSRQIIAARQGSWDTVAELLERLLRAQHHVGGEAGMIASLESWRFGLLVFTSFQRCLLVAPGPPPAALVRRLRIEFERRLDTAPSAAHVAAEETLISRLALDTILAGKFGDREADADRRIGLWALGFLNPFAATGDFIDAFAERHERITLALIEAAARGEAVAMPEFPNDFRTAPRWLDPLIAPAYFVVQDSRWLLDFEPTRVAFDRAAVVALAALEHALGGGEGFPAMPPDDLIRPEHLVDPWSAEGDRLVYRATAELVAVASVGSQRRTIQSADLARDLGDVVSDRRSERADAWLALPGALAALEKQDAEEEER